jgi:peptidoglycan/LPS O-acetylase OafA/YrhL
MLKRILLSYLGAFVVPICLLPLTITETMGGHSLMYSAVLGLPIGATLALWYCDFRRHYRPIAALVRSVVGLLSFVLMALVLGGIKVSPVWTNHGWVLIPACGPLVAAVISGLILTTRVKPKT